MEKYFLTPFDRDYPQRLREIPSAPSGIYVWGRQDWKDKLSISQPVIAVIGARDCSEYGKYIARELGTFLGKNKITLVSGMARGIDSISQWAALEAGGSSIAVLGCGADVCYPEENRPLYQRLLEEGAVISEYAQGTPPRQRFFPARNRIVSGLADAVVVVEARKKSGTLITVDMALEQGREVFVVPGRITDSLSEGCNRLLRQGANLLLSPEQLLEEVWELKLRTLPKQKKPTADKRSGAEKDKKDKAEKDKAERDKAEKDKAEKDRAEKDRTEKGRAEKDKAEKDKTEKDKIEKDTIDKRDKIEGNKRKENKKTAPLETQVLFQLDFSPQSAQSITERLVKEKQYEEISVKEVLLCLLQLTLENKAIQVSPGCFCKKS